MERTAPAPYVCDESDRKACHALSGSMNDYVPKVQNELYSEVWKLSSTNVQALLPCAMLLGKLKKQLTKPAVKFILSFSILTT